MFTHFKVKPSQHISPPKFNIFSQESETSAKGDHECKKGVSDNERKSGESSRRRGAKTATETEKTEMDKEKEGVDKVICKRFYLISTRISRL